MFVLCTRWEVELLPRYPSFLCLDSTHNTYCDLDGNRSESPHSIVINHDDAGCRVPVAFINIDSETKVPLVEWLGWLGDTVPLDKTPIFITDFSNNEAAAINAVFEEPEIRFGYWHLLRALRAQASSKISISPYRSAAIAYFKDLIWTKTSIKFNFALGNHK